MNSRWSRAVTNRLKQITSGGDTDWSLLLVAHTQPIVYLTLPPPTLTLTSLVKLVIISIMGLWANLDVLVAVAAMPELVFSRLPVCTRGDVINRLQHQSELSGTKEPIEFEADIFAPLLVINI